jgi:hypothetical protein
MTVVPFFLVQIDSGAFPHEFRRYTRQPRERILRTSASSRSAASWHRRHKGVQGAAVRRLSPSEALQHRQAPKTSAFMPARATRSLRSKPEPKVKLAFGRLLSAVRQISSSTSALFLTPVFWRGCILVAGSACPALRLGPLIAKLLGHERRQRSLRFSVIRFIILAGRSASP